MNGLSLYSNGSVTISSTTFFQWSSPFLSILLNTVYIPSWPSPRSRSTISPCGDNPDRSIGCLASIFRIADLTTPVSTFPDNPITIPPEKAPLHCAAMRAYTNSIASALRMTFICTYNLFSHLFYTLVCLPRLVYNACQPPRVPIIFLSILIAQTLTHPNTNSQPTFQLVHSSMNHVLAPNSCQTPKTTFQLVHSSTYHVLAPNSCQTPKTTFQLVHSSMNHVLAPNSCQTPKTTFPVW
mmetsp:Transcript_12858/g.27538  ORF Transcript_12858/g.27538 Transcript_12858/m.27538 type:complete len:239 (-) Transcript_12858:10-726(-)